MDVKALFLKEKDLVKWWVSVSNDHRFEQVCAYALADYVATVKTHEEMQGAKDFINKLATLSQNEDLSQEIPGPGLIHNVEAMPEKPLPVEQPKPIKPKKSK